MSARPSARNVRPLTLSRCLVTSISSKSASTSSSSSATKVALKKAGRIYGAFARSTPRRRPRSRSIRNGARTTALAVESTGDVFTWMETQEGLSPAEALTTLGRAGRRRAHAPGARGAQVRGPSPRRRTTRRSFYFRQALRNTPRGKTVAEYLAKRGITPESIDAFGIGYAPNERVSLLAYLKKKGFSEDEGVAAGLIIKNDNGLYDRFQDRLMLPIRDRRGRDDRLRRAGDAAGPAGQVRQLSPDRAVQQGRDALRPRPGERGHPEGGHGGHRRGPVRHRRLPPVGLHQRGGVDGHGAHRGPVPGAQRHEDRAGDRRLRRRRRRAALGGVARTGAPERPQPLRRRRRRRPAGHAHGPRRSS